MGGPSDTSDVSDPWNKAAGTSRPVERRVRRGEGIGEDMGEGIGVYKLGEGVR